MAVRSAAAGAAALGAVWLFSKWPWFGAPVIVPVVAPATATQPLPANEEMIELLLRRGDAALADGDIIAARLLYERAAAMGSAKAATSAGKTYDVDFLAQSGARGIRPDQTAAATWFRKAAALGDPEARSLLARIEGRPQP
jgi:TPR repeat protein